ncbi:MAG: amino acid permease, partial [Candidatus Omnitrophica bacterium]|nr:amino acid permease [Candidatus Omnitrophota bacterium]
RTGTIAILAYVFAEYARRITPFDEVWLRPLASAAVILLTAVNVAGVRWGKYTQNFFTVLKIAALLLLVSAGVSLFLGGKSTPVAWTDVSFSFSTIQSMGVAFVFVLWTYGGWTEAAYIAEEVQNPTRNVPRAIVLGLLATTVLYLLVNWSYLLFVPLSKLPQTPFVASEVMQSWIGPAGAIWIAVMVACSAFGALNGYILTGARILYAMGKDHALFATLGQVHPSWHTPARALWANAAIAILLIFTKTFEQIMTYSTVVISVFFILAVFGVIRLRRLLPRHPRPYRALGYPLSPILFCLTMAGFILDVCVKEPRESIFGFALLGLGLPLYWWSEKNSKQHSAHSKQK